uniref:Uncharacterized protein n=1 Tax=Tanacetum cinerariifolium TaxID=118510 RepID=A0A6L2KVP1_TANCI|nr:hypothetical protein [Tanacetum cinerariifolium]
MNTTQAQQKALDDALVSPADHLEFEKCNMRLKTDIKPRKLHFKSFTINKKKFSLGAEVFREILPICAKVLGQRFEETPLEHDILSFLRDLGHFGYIHYITGVSIDYLHQPWRAIATIINKCLSGKGTAYEKICLSRAQILWGMDQSISRRKKMFWHTAHDDTMFTSMRCVSRHEKTQVYGVILPQHLANQVMLESITYQTYYAFATGEKALKEKYARKKAKSDTSPKKKTAPASKGYRLISSAKVAKTDKKKQPAKIPKTKGLDVLIEVALAEAEQIKLATKKSKKDFHMSHASGSGDGVDTPSKVPDEQQQKFFGTNEGADVRPEVLDVPKYDSESDEESWTLSQDEDDADEETYVNDDSEVLESANDGDDLTHPNLSTYKADDKEEEGKEDDDKEVSSDHRVSTPPEYELTKEEEKENKDGEDEDMEGEQEQDEEDDLYKDVNINLERSDAEITNAQENQDTKDTHATLTIVPVVQQQSSSFSSDIVLKFINPSQDIGIDSILNPNIHSKTLVNVPVSVAAETHSSDKTIPQPHIPTFNLYNKQQVSALETEMFEFRQTNQFAKAISSISALLITTLLPR